ncbi:MAG: pantetheine-phosphate adenylyltransferase [Alicyclobacillus sp.]|nr:pantetheine-phosphate adenylyltransferase [Alicyclobacillus sp.]
MKRAVYPGSFDPLTNGHLDIVQKAVRLFDEVTVAVLHNPEKQPLFSVAERVALAAEALADVPGVRVDSFTGLLADYARRVQADAVVRGIRGTQDVASELPMAQMNARLNPEVTTVFFATDVHSADISSTLVRQIAKFGGDVSGLVPPNVAAALAKRFAAATEGGH